MLTIAKTEYKSLSPVTIRLFLLSVLIMQLFTAMGQNNERVTAHFDSDESSFTIDPDSVLQALAKLKVHINQINNLTATEIKAIDSVVQNNHDLFGTNKAIITASIDLVNSFENIKGALFTTNKTSSGIPRKPRGGLELERTILSIQQVLIDCSYTTDNLNNFVEVFENKKFQTSSYFPGKVDRPSDPKATEVITVNASHLKAWGTQANGAEAAARRPTGCYLAPGSIAEVNVPSGIVGKGYKIRVGAHFWDLKRKAEIKRMDRVAILYDIESTSTLVANPLGGNIYIEVPYELAAGLVEISLSNVVRAPFFSYKESHETTLSEWKNVERNHPGPWADFESDNYMMQVPTSWIYNFDDPQSLMQNWDRAIGAVSEMLGRPSMRTKTPTYVQVDVIMRGGAYFPGYPMSNYPYDPNASTNGNIEHNLLKGPKETGNIHWHEHGHQENITKFPGETEAIVNFLYIAALNRKFEMPLDLAFKNSFSPKLNIYMDDAIEMRLASPTFLNGKARNISNVPGDEVKYQHRGYAHYVEMVDLFGWCALDKFWYSESVDFMNGIIYNTNNPDQDDRIYRMSKAANIDLRPLFHFWGIHPEEPSNLQSLIEAANLPASSKIYDRLVYYRSLILKNNKEFNAHAYERYPDGFSGKKNNPLYGKGYYEVWSPLYNETHAKQAQLSLQSIIELYFKKGRPVDLDCSLCDSNPEYKIGQNKWVSGTKVNAKIGEQVTLLPGNLDRDNWSWTGPDGFTSNLRTLSIRTSNQDEFGMYTANYKDDYGCSTFVEFEILVNEK